MASQTEAQDAMHWQGILNKHVEKERLRREAIALLLNDRLARSKIEAVLAILVL